VRFLCQRIVKVEVRLTVLCVWGSFENFFSKYSTSPEKDGLSVYDIMNGIKGQRLVMDPFGWLGAIFECRYFSILACNFH
jgi:hypothetical protein